MCDFKFEILSTKHETNSNFPMTKTMLIKILKWVPGSWNSARPPDFEEFLGFGNSDFENLDLFRNWGPARRVGSPEDQFRYSDFGFDYGVKPVRYSTLA